LDTIFPWHEIYHNTLTLDHISVAEKMLRPLVVYLCLIVGLRVAGKRELAQINPLDLIVLLTLSNTVQNAIIGSDNSVTGGLLGAATLLAANFVLTRTAFSSRRFDSLINGNPVDLIKDGAIQHDELDRLLMSEKELLAVVRQQGLHSLKEVETATLETSGTISIQKHQPSPEISFLESVNDRLARIEKALSIEPPPVPR
jgi:uncharacterized membrane protein YcaP (DUF421 family)